MARVLRFPGLGVPELADVEPAVRAWSDFVAERIGDALRFDVRRGGRKSVSADDVLAVAVELELGDEYGDPFCRPVRTDAMAGRLGVSVGTVRAALDVLDRLGVIRWERFKMLAVLVPALADQPGSSLTVYRMRLGLEPPT